MPPKAKLHAKHGKLKAFTKNAHPPLSTAPNSSTADSLPSTSTNETSNTNNNQQLESEVVWCVQQLEESLSSNKLNPKQIQESQSILKTLKSKTQPLVRKRQLMRMHFGDYRAKMAAEEKKAKIAHNQISFTKNKKSIGKSTFIKKSSLLTTGDNTFRFNFQPRIDNEIPIPNDTSMGQTNSDNICAIDNDFSNLNLHSGSEFKFNFRIDESR